jgi:hypothetical protein
MVGSLTTFIAQLHWPTEERILLWLEVNHPQGQFTHITGCTLQAWHAGLSCQLGLRDRQQVLIDNEDTDFQAEFDRVPRSQRNIIFS